MRGITYLYHSDEISESWTSIFSHNVEKLIKWVTLLTHIAKFLRADLQIFPTASEKFWGEKQFCLTVTNFLRVDFPFCLKISKKNMRRITNLCHSVEQIKQWFTYLSHNADNFESWFRSLSHYIEKIMRWITYLYLSDEIFESWNSIFSHNVEKLTKWVTTLTHSANFLRGELQFCPAASENFWGEKPFCLTVPKTLRVEFQFCLRMSKKAWGELQTCVIVLKNSRSDWLFCLTLPKILKAELEDCLTTSKKFWNE